MCEQALKEAETIILRAALKKYRTNLGQNSCERVHF